MERINLKALDKAALTAFLTGLGQRPYRAGQVYRWLYARGATEFAAMTDLARDLRALLEDRAELPRLRVVKEQTAADGTRKYLFGLPDGHAVESVWIPEPGRTTVCVSTQVGCALACSFCLTGQGGLTRNLEAWEIAEQVLELGRLRPEAPVTNVVLMGMGEPLTNLPAVVPALERLVDPEGMHLAPRRVTVSTAGLVPQMAELGRRAPYVNLAVSLGATTDALRDELIPVNGRWPLAELMAACRAYPLPPRRRVFFEYMLIRGLNDTPADARRLVKLVHGVRCKVNLMAYNPVPGVPYERPDEETVTAFQKTLTDAGLRAFVRRSRGRDILAACGQLKGAPEPGRLAVV
jgi:23S rRNA (adenine2503-C2)-methyltransferase